jgi:cytochrome b
MQIKVWDPLVRVMHWTIATGFIANAAFTNPEHQLHHLIGYTIAGLVALRVVWGFAGPRHARFTDFPPSATASLEQIGEMVTGRRNIHRGHSPLGALMIYNLLACLAGLALTGWMMGTDAWFGIKWVKDLHETIATWAELSVAAHVAAVIFESRRLGVNLPVAMLTGYKSLPESADGGE